jgi:hypothetical protein
MASDKTRQPLGWVAQSVGEMIAPAEYPCSRPDNFDHVLYRVLRHVVDGASEPVDTSGHHQGRCLPFHCTPEWLTLQIRWSGQTQLKGLDPCRRWPSPPSDTLVMSRVMGYT